MKSADLVRKTYTFSRITRSAQLQEEDANLINTCRAQERE